MEFDLDFYSKKFMGKTSFFMAGTDEVGRGPLAGPVVAASVSLFFKVFNKPEFKKLLKEWKNLNITDSKKLTAKKREEILKVLGFKNDQFFEYDYSKNITVKILIKEIHPEEIDKINILNASLKAMKEAVMGNCDKEWEETLPETFGLVLIDGNKKFKLDSPQIELIPIIKGDSKSLLIGLASIVAKVYRDRLMKKHSEEYPGYFWEQNAGYGTVKHMDAIRSLGITPLHRKSFKGVLWDLETIGQATS